MVRYILLIIFVSILSCNRWQITSVQLGHTPSKVQEYLKKRPKYILKKGRYEFLYYDPPGRGGDYVFIFYNSHLLTFGPEGKLPGPDKLDQLDQLQRE